MTDQPTTWRPQIVQDLRAGLTPAAVDAAATFARNPDQPAGTFRADLRGKLTAGDTGDAVGLVAGVFAGAACDRWPMHDATRLTLAAFALALSDLADQLNAEARSTEDNEQ
jgi:hypothetical protein